MLNYEKIGKQIRKYRKQNGLSQEQLAEKIWISTTHMSHIETGSTKLSLPVLVDIAGVLGVSVDELLSITPDSQKQESAESISEVLKSCTVNQVKIITDIVISAKSAMDKYS
ncbi:MAG: helix-turn-helix domain-containing protein [Acutalibacteraceae bacterium]